MEADWAMAMTDTRIIREERKNLFIAIVL